MFIVELCKDGIQVGKNRGMNRVEGFVRHDEDEIGVYRWGFAEDEIQLSLGFLCKLLYIQSSIRLGFLFFIFFLRELEFRGRANPRRIDLNEAKQR